MAWLPGILAHAWVIQRKACKMSKGKAKANYLHRAGLVGKQNGPDWSYIYETSLVKDAKWNIGDRTVLPDGREFIYSKSSGVCASGQGCDFVAASFQPYTTPATSAAVGDTSIAVVGTTHDALTKDALRGGFFISWPGADKDTIRGIIGNDAASANANFVVYLDGPLNQVHTAGSTGLEIFANPYGSLVEGASSSLGKAGVPATYVNAADTFFWVQRHGICWLAPQSDVINNHTGAYFRHDGSIEAEIDFEDKTQGTNSTQYAGHRVVGNYAGDGPLFYLTG